MSLRTKRKKHETTECVTKLEREWGELHSMEDRCVDKHTQQPHMQPPARQQESRAVCMHKHSDSHGSIQKRTVLLVALAAVAAVDIKPTATNIDMAQPGHKGAAF
jgi:hypothetical protein